ncbi:MAG: hypothetical protein ACR5K5_05850 [Wolbachia sp.]
MVCGNRNKTGFQRHALPYGCCSRIFSLSPSQCFFLIMPVPFSCHSSSSPLVIPVLDTGIQKFLN